MASVVLPQPVSFDVRESTIASVQYAIVQRIHTVREIVEAFLCRIEALNPLVNAIISLHPDALQVADELDAAFANVKAKGLLFGVPVLLKDNFDVAGQPTTGGCRSLAELRPNTDAPVVKALKDAGAIILGKTNLHEFALEGLTVSSLGGQTRNPYDLTRTPGGSSGGSGAAVAMSFCVFATGTDTMNSLRSPASANSLYSVRPTRGLISRDGIMPVSHTQDAVGPIARSVEDLAIALTVMSSISPDIGDSTVVQTTTRSLDYSQKLGDGSLMGMRFGILEGFFNRTDDPEVVPVNEAMGSAIETIESMGAETVSIAEPIYDSLAILADCDTQRFEVREVLSRYLQRPEFEKANRTSFEDVFQGEDFLVIPKQYGFIHTAAVSSTSTSGYDQVKANIEHLSTALEATFSRNKLDAIIYPEQKSLVVKIGSASQTQRNGILAAVTGSPVVTVAIAFSKPTAEAAKGVPIGMEILGRHGSEQMLLQTAFELERMSRIRRAPDIGKVLVDSRPLQAVPVVVPDVSIPHEYPPGTVV